MKSTEQFKFRERAPGVIAVAYIAVPLLLKGQDLEWADALLPLAFLMLAYPYHAFKIRERLAAPAFNRVNATIADWLFKACGRTTTMADGAEAFKRLRFSYYQIIDNDESLKVLGERIRRSGTRLTTIADFILITAVVVLLYVVAALVLNWMELMVFAVVALVIALFTRSVIYPRTISNHIDLCREQVDAMVAKYPSQVCAMVSAAATN